MLGAEALAAANKQLKLSQEAQAKAQSSADSAARQADKLTEKLANMPKVQLQACQHSCCSAQICSTKSHT